MRQDKKRTVRNAVVKTTYKKAVKTFLTNPVEKKLSEVFQALDRARKKGVIHKNKASRLKSQLSKKLGKPIAKNQSKTTKLKAKK